MGRNRIKAPVGRRRLGHVLMLGWLARRRLRREFYGLLDGGLPPAQEARLREEVALDPHLSAELARLEFARDALRSLPTERPPHSFRIDLAVDLDLLEQPLRARYSELLDGSLGATEAADLRAKVDGHPVLRDELRLLEAVVAVARALPVEPLPNGFRAALNRRLDELAPVPPRRVPRLAYAGAAALLCLTVGLGRLAWRSVTAPSQPVAERVATLPPDAPAAAEPGMADLRAEPPPAPAVVTPAVRPAIVAPPAEHVAAPPSVTVARRTTPSHRPTVSRRLVVRAEPRPATPARRPTKPIATTSPRLPAPRADVPEALAIATGPAVEAVGLMLSATGVTSGSAPPRPAIPPVRVTEPATMRMASVRPRIPDPSLLNSPEPTSVSLAFGPATRYTDTPMAADFE